MQTLKQIHIALETAKQSPGLDSCKAYLNVARAALAEAVIAGETLDETTLEDFILASGELSQRYIAIGDAKRGIAWISMVGAFSDCLRTYSVPMPDGRVATADGWNTENCPPEGTQLLGS